MTSLREAFGDDTWSRPASASQTCPSGQKIFCPGSDTQYGCLCTDCPTGMYSCGGSDIPDKLGDYSCGEKSDGWPTSCASCKAGTRTSASGSTCCSWCPDGEISGGSATWCQACPNNKIPNADKTVCVNPIGNVDDAIRYQRIDHCNGKDWTVTPEQSLLSLNDLSDKNVALGAGSTASSYMDNIWGGQINLYKDTITYSTIAKDSDYGVYQQCNQGAGDGGLCDWGCAVPIGSIDILTDTDVGTPNDQTYILMYCSCMEGCVCYNTQGYYFKANGLTDASGTLPSGTKFLPYDPSIDECETTTCNDNEGCTTCPISKGKWVVSGTEMNVFNCIDGTCEKSSTLLYNDQFAQNTGRQLQLLLYDSTLKNISISSQNYKVNFDPRPTVGWTPSADSNWYSLPAIGKDKSGGWSQLSTKTICAGCLQQFLSLSDTTCANCTVDSCSDECINALNPSNGGTPYSGSQKKPGDVPNSIEIADKWCPTLDQCLTCDSECQTWMTTDQGKDAGIDTIVDAHCAYKYRNSWNSTSASSLKQSTKKTTILPPMDPNLLL